MLRQSVLANHEALPDYRHACVLVIAYIVGQQESIYFIHPANFAIDSLA
jgi:hypothetical protein